MLYPQCRVAMDGRYETVYPGDVFEGYLDFILPRDGWRHFLDSYPHEIIIVNASSRIRALLGAHPGWEEKYSDPTCALLVKKQSRLSHNPPSPRPTADNAGVLNLN